MSRLRCIDANRSQMSEQLQVFYFPEPRAEVRTAARPTLSSWLSLCLSNSLSVSSVFLSVSEVFYYRSKRMSQTWQAFQQATVTYVNWLWCTDLDVLDSLHLLECIGSDVLALVNWAGLARDPGYRWYRCISLVALGLRIALSPLA